MTGFDAVNDLNWTWTLEDEVIDDDRKIKGLSDRVSRLDGTHHGEAYSFVGRGETDPIHFPRA